MRGLTSASTARAGIPFKKCKVQNEKFKIKEVIS